MVGKQAAFVLASELACPWCGRTNRLHDAIDAPATPQVGDCSICWNCRCVGMFELYSIRRPTQVELDYLEAMPKINRTQLAIETFGSPHDALRETRRYFDHEQAQQPWREEPPTDAE